MQILLRHRRMDIMRYKWRLYGWKLEWKFQKMQNYENELTNPQAFSRLISLSIILQNMALNIKWFYPGKMSGFPLNNISSWMLMDSMDGLSQKSKKFTSCDWFRIPTGSVHRRRLLWKSVYLAGWNGHASCRFDLWAERRTVIHCDEPAILHPDSAQFRS